MPGDTLQEFDRLVAAGFNEVQARALVEAVGAPARTDPEVTETLKLVVRELSEVKAQVDSMDNRLGLHSAAIGTLTGEISGLKGSVEVLSLEYRTLHQDQSKIRGDLHVVGERVKMEGRVARMINVALIAIGATVASLLAVFAR